MWEKELQIAKKAAVEAGHAIMEIYESQESVQIEYKEGEMPLTVADRRANTIITDTLRSAFPKYALLSEEGEEDESRLTNEFCFIVDPLDGTKEFLKRNGQFTVNIALSYKNRSIMGVIYIPASKELYYASQGKGAFLERNGVRQQLYVSERIQDLRIVMSSSHDCIAMEEFIARHELKHFIKMGSSLKGCLVAKGDAELYYRYNPTMEWDTAAMQCLVEEAGGVLRQMDDTEMRYNRKNSLNEKGFYIINRIENRLR